MHKVKQIFIFTVILFFAGWCELFSLFAASKDYFPAPGSWEKRDASKVGMDAELLKEAVSFAIANETKADRDLAIAHYQSFGREPFGDAIGPFAVRGEPTGMIIRNGFVVAEWGNPDRVDMTFSVTKSFLSTTVGLAYDRRLIPNLKEPVWKMMAPVTVLQNGGMEEAAERLGKGEFYNPFDTDHNRKISWEHLLRQTSDWEGTLWGKPDWSDRPGEKPEEWFTRKRNEPGAAYEYNDVRVNALALAALNIWRRPLPQVLREYVMDPIGASSTWRWHGYENSWVLIDGSRIQSVSGGGHWGGGMFINANDMARFGYLTLRRGKWNGKQILSEEWVRMALTPTAVQETYGFMNWFLNTSRKFIPSAPASAFAHMGNGTNMIYADPENDLVIVVRWINRDSIDGFIQRVIAAIKKK